MFLELPADFSSAIDREADSVLLRTARCDSSNQRSYLFRGCLETLVATALAEIPGVFAKIEAALCDGRYVAGFLSYECGAHFEPRALYGRLPQPSADGLPLAWFGVYEAPVIFDHAQAASLEPQVSPLRAQRSGREDTGAAVDFGDKVSADRSEPASNSIPAELGISLSEYRDRVAQIKRYIEAGDTYQVNLTTGVRMPYSGPASALFATLMRSQPVAYGALLNLGETQILSASPELFFRTDGDHIATQPMKGTAARGRDLLEDAAIAAWLARDEKNRSENVMIVDLLRNDLGRICMPGSVSVEKLFAVESFRTLFQMTSTVIGRLRPGMDFYGIFKALFPSGSIIGAPKIRTMQIIHELESGASRGRGIYTGAIGFFSPDRKAVFNVAIRTLVLRDGMAAMGVGSGIVYDSNAEAEYEECRLKAAFLTRPVPEFKLIETMLWDGEYFLLVEHLERLEAAARYFDFHFDAESIGRSLAELSSGFAMGERYRVRLLLEQTGVIELSHKLVDDVVRPLDVMLSAERIDSSDLFQRHKTTRRSVYDRGYQEAAAAGFDEVLFLNERGEIAEGAIHNVVVEKDGRWATPPISAGALPGVYRRHLLETRSDCEERSLTVEEIRRADRVFLCNSVRGMRRVGSIRENGKLLFSDSGVAE